MPVLHIFSRRASSRVKEKTREESHVTPPPERKKNSKNSNAINQSYSYPDDRNRPSTTPFSFSSLSFQFLTYHSQGKHRARIHSFVSQEEGLKRLSLEICIYLMIAADAQWNYFLFFFFSMNEWAE